MEIRMALAGNPNSGKTTLFNALTGANQYVGNWPGVTIEKKEGKLKIDKNVRLVDLPGIYSLSPYSPEEVVSRNYLLEEKPQVIINIIDGTNIERNLYLTTQLKELGIPMVLAINMMDVVEKRGDRIDFEKMEKMTGCPVVQISALKSTGINELAEIAMKLVEAPKPYEEEHPFVGALEHNLAHIEDLLRDSVEGVRLRWFSLKVFERDNNALKYLGLNKEDETKLLAVVEPIIEKCEEEMDDDAESIVINARYEYVTRLTEKIYQRKSKSIWSYSDRIDRVVTNKWLALPLFALVMTIVYYVSVTTVGAWATDWANEVLFGEWVPGFIEKGLVALNTAPWLNGLVLDGIVAGVGAVLGFVPQMFVLFAFLAILESCGYMARVAFIMDRLFRKFGLSGKSFIPMLVGSGCGVPGVMASRTIESEKERRMTVMTVTFVPCGAKLPIIALIAGAIFKGAWWVAPSAYFIGVAAIVISGIILKKSRMFAGDPSPFVMELPPYHWPLLSGVAHCTWERGFSFVKKAGTIVLLSTIIIWFASNFGFQNGGVQMVGDMKDGFLSSIGGAIAPIFAPLGWGNWQGAVATITGLVAKENVVGAFGVLYGLSEVAEDGVEIWGALSAGFTALSAYSFLVFNLLCSPCFAAIGAIKKEMNSAKWTWFALGYQTGFAYGIALIIYQIGSFISTGTFTFWVAVAIITLIVLVYFVVRPHPDRSKKQPIIDNV